MKQFIAHVALFLEIGVAAVGLFALRVVDPASVPPLFGMVTVAVTGTLALRTCLDIAGLFAPNKRSTP